MEPQRTLSPSAYRHVVFPSAFPPRLAPQNHAPGVATPTGIREAEPTEDDAFVRWVFERCGLNSSDYRPQTLRRRVGACLRALRVASVVEARAAIARSPGNLLKALGSLLIGVTGFFRDLPEFAYLKDRVLPELIRGDSGPRIWSVGCSDGAELYSVAILLAELNALHRCHLLGTDCRREAIEQAAEAMYDPAAVEAVPRHLLLKYFHASGTKWRANAMLRTAVQWRTADALSVAEPGLWDLILCRNMAIYVAPPAAAKLWNRLSAALRPGGVLMLGKAERAIGADGLTPITHGFLRRTGSERFPTTQE